MATNKSKNEMYSNLWEKYRPNTEINFSDIIEDKTIYESNQSTKTTFDPNEITGRSTLWKNGNSNTDDIDVDAVSVKDILCNSFVETIRHMSQNKQGGDDKSLSIGFTHKNSAANTINSKEFEWNSSISGNTSNAKLSDSMKSENFKPFNEMENVLLKDEKEWQKEFATIPSDSNYDVSQNKESLAKSSKKLVNYTEFSGLLNDSNSSSTEMSIGKYFSRKCEDIRSLIPNLSPTKTRPIPLLGNSYRSGVC